MTGTARSSKDTYLVTQNRRIMDVPDKIMFLQPDAAPLVQILFRAKKKDTINPKFTWFEKDLFPKRDTVGTGAANTSTATTFTVSNGGYFRAYDLIKDESTGEQMLVTGVSSNTLTVIRAYGVTTVNTITASDYIVVLGNANPEGARSPGVKSMTEDELYNYVQDFRTPFEVTDILANSDLYGGSEMQNERLIHAVEHKVDIERAFLFGEKYLDTSTTTPIRTTGGILSFISTNVTTMTTATESAFETFCEDAFAYGSNTKLLMASAKLISALNYWARGKLTTVPKDKTYGIDVKEYLTGHGTLLVAKHRLLTGSKYGGYGVVVDLNNLSVRGMKGLGATKLRTNIQDNDATKEKDEYRTVAGLQVNNEQTHAVIKGVTAYS